jgi:predicted amidohydrolase
MPNGLPIALIQTRSPATAEAGLAHVEPLIRQAAADGAKLILTPEGTNLLEQRRDRRAAAITDEAQDPCVLGLRRLAAELDIWLLIGSAIRPARSPPAMTSCTSSTSTCRTARPIGRARLSAPAKRLLWPIRRGAAWA